MFNKPAPKTGLPASDRLVAPPLTLAEVAVTRSKTSAISVLAQNLTIEGTLQSDSEIQIDGIVRGDIRAEKLIIGETGQIEGQIIADIVEAKGRVMGTITAKQVRLYATAQVQGDITHEQLSIESGASFEGRSMKFQRPKAVAPANSTGATPAV